MDIAIKLLSKREFVSVEMLAKETGLSIDICKELLYRLKKGQDSEFIYCTVEGNSFVIKRGEDCEGPSVIGVVKKNNTLSLFELENEWRMQFFQGTTLNFPVGKIQFFLQPERVFSSGHMHSTKFTVNIKKADLRTLVSKSVVFKSYMPIEKKTYTPVPFISSKENHPPLKRKLTEKPKPKKQLRTQKSLLEFYK